MLRETLVAFAVFLVILLIVHHKQEEEVWVVVTPTYNQKDLDSVIASTKPYKAYDGCMASCGGCDAYNTEPVLREMVYFNNLYDKEHSYECDPATFEPFARVYDH
jgi:hypothetical protein